MKTQGAKKMEILIYSAIAAAYGIILAGYIGLIIMHTREARLDDASASQVILTREPAEPAT